MTEKIRLHIKNMVCDRCRRVVSEELSSLGYRVLKVILGEAEITAEGRELNIEEIRKVLAQNGFELLDDQKTQLIEQVKLAVIALIHQNKLETLQTNVSGYIAERVGKDYNYLSSLFSASEGLTIEKYLILQRIERAKELLIYNELSLKEIAWQLNYSSAAHLSSQFKKITGLTPGAFKKVGEERRRTIDKLTS